MSTDLQVATAAKPPVPSRGTANESIAAGRPYLAFRLAGEVYAIDILRIREIIEYTAPTAVPMMPRTVRGVINLRGAVVQVIDLAVRFGLDPTGVGRRRWGRPDRFGRRGGGHPHLHRRRRTSGF